MRLAAWAFGGPLRFGLAERAGRLLQRPALRAGLLSRWTRTRDLQPIPRESFRDWWSRERGT
jgi:L-lactate dehydrogenase complex protein LldF